MVNRLETQISARDKSKRAFASFNSNLDRSRKRMRGLSIALGGFVSIAGAMRLGQLTNDAIKFGSQIAITSDKIGLSANSLQALRLAGEQFAGVQATTVDMALQRFSRRLGEADRGTGELKDTLIQLGISTRNADGSVKSVEQAFLEYSDAMANAESAQEQLRLAFKAFDSEGAVLVELAKQGSEELKGFMESAKATGAVMSGTMTAKAKDLNAEFRMQTMIIGTQLKEAFMALAPIVLSVLTVVGKVASAVNKLFKSALDEFKEMIEDENLEELQNRLNKQLEERIELQKKVDQGGRTGTRAKKELDALNLQIEATEKSIEVNKLLKDSNDEQSKGVNHLAEAFKNLNNAQTIAETQAKQFATKFQTGLTQAFDNIIDGTKSVGASLKELGKTLLREAIRMVIFRTIIAPFTGAFGGFLDKLGLPGKAMGGSVSKGRPYMVGEQGAELFVPGQSGTIIPNHKLGGGGVVINQNINFATGVQATVRNEVLGMLPLISQASVGAVAEAKRRGATS
tara:strand:- start:5750 stop:7291 length:1542 start_codon:yes stop_codon:yes gene_type:complete